MAHDDRILTQAEIDSLLRKNLPKPDASVASVSPASVKPIELAKVKEAVLSSPPPVSVKQVELAQVKEAALPRPSTASVKPPEPLKPKAADTSPSLRPMTATNQECASDEIGSLKENIADLSRQVSKLTVAMQTVAQLEEKVKQLEAMIKLSPDSTRTLKGRIDEISGMLEMIQQKKSDYSFYEEFQCSQCRSKSLVAIHVKCTNCGKENWMGWWPEENSK